MSTNPKPTLVEKLRAKSPMALQEHAERQIVTPVDILNPQPHKPAPQQVEKTTKQPNVKTAKPQSDKTASPQADKTISTQTNKTTSILTDKPTTPQAHKPTTPQVEKYTTHLRPETIKAIKVYGAEHDVADYDVVQEALDLFFKSR